MQRFRRKSDAKPPRSPIGDRKKAHRVPSPTLSSLPPTGTSLPLFSTNDFRTSLILPSLERRFTLLRTSNGSPVPLGDVKNKFAQQRAAGAEYQISEEEERIILSELERISAENHKSSPHDLPDHHTFPSSPSMLSTRSQSPTSTTKRPKYYGNSLFSSSHSSDAHYIRKIARNGSDRSLLSKSSDVKAADISISYPFSKADDEPELEALTRSGFNTTGHISDKTPLARQLNLQPNASPPPILGRHERKNSRAELARISMALSNVMKEIEEEGILESDSGPSSARRQEKRISITGKTQSSIERNGSIQNRIYINTKPSHVVQGDCVDTGSQSPHARSSATSPTPRIPGYIPGMPRPLTPKSFAHEDSSRPRSTTPRAYSPLTSGGDQQAPQGILRRGSQSSNTRALPRTDSPVFVGSSSRRRLEQPYSRSYSPSISYDRSHPLSPLYTSELPSPQLTSSSDLYDELNYNRSNGIHTRGISAASSHMYPGFTHERSYSGAQSIAVSTLPDTPLLSTSHPVAGSTSQNRPIFRPLDSVSPSTSMGSQNIQSVIGGPGYTRFRIGSQDFSVGQSSNPVALSPGSRSPPPVESPLLMLSSWQNSSQTSLLSTGSSYHSTRDAARQASDAAFSLISPTATPGTTPDDQDESRPEWEIANPSVSMKVEEAMQIFGLKEEDLANMQEKLIQLASPDLVLTPQTPGLRRRKNSIPSRATSPVHVKDGSFGQTNEEPKMKLLNSMLHSIESAMPGAAAVTPATETPIALIDSNPLDSYVDVGRSASALAGLADALFGNPQGELEDVPVGSEIAPTLPNEVEDGTTHAQITSEDSIRIGELSISVPTQSKDDVDDSLDDWGHVDAQELKSSTGAAEKREATQVEEPSSSTPSFSAAETPSEGSNHESPASVTKETQAESEEEAKLLQDIARRAAEATAALKSPSQIGFEQLPQKRPPTKRMVAPANISSPQLIPPPSRMNTYTIYSPSSNDISTVEQRSPSKLSQQMKKLKGSFRGAKTPNGEEVTPWVYNPESSNSPDEVNSINLDASFTSNGSFPFHVGNPPEDRSRRATTPSLASPLSPGTSLRSIFGRFRRPKRELQIDPFRESGSPSIQLTLGHVEEGKPASATSTLFRRPSTSQSGALLHKRLQQGAVSTNVIADVERQSTPQFPPIENAQITSLAAESEEVKKLFAAASNLGVDREELSRLLSRSTSVSSKSIGGNMAASPEPSDTTRPTTAVSSSIEEKLDSLSRAASLQTRDLKSHGRKAPSADIGMNTDDSGVIDTDQTITMRRVHGSKRKPSLKKNANISPVGRGPGFHDNLENADSTILRRTLIIPSNGEDGDAITELESLLRRNSKARKRGSLQGGHTSKTSRDLHDRVPTPPPSRARRFSAGKASPAPPVPGIITTLASPTLSTFSGISKYSNNSQLGNYDSFYDMYDETENHDQDISLSTRPSIPRESVAPNSGPALQLLEMANGETIWSIINDLRNIPGEDMANFDRRSFSSEYSRPASPSHDDTMQLRFKEHQRQASKSSANSYLPSAIKNSMRSTAARPETKVFMSTTNQIGRLIESLSKGMDAGSFNILPVEGDGRSNAPVLAMSTKTPFDRNGDSLRGESPRPSSSLRSDLSVDAQLEHMIGKLNVMSRSSEIRK